MNALLKAIAAIGFIMLLVLQLYPGANASWSNFTTGLQAGPSMPSFPTSNPSAPQQVINEQAVTLMTTSNGKLNLTGTWLPHPPHSIVNLVGMPACDAATWYGCTFPTESGSPYADNGSYVTLTSSDFFYTVNTSSTGDQTNGHYIADGVAILVTCRSSDATWTPTNYEQFVLYQHATGIAGDMIPLAEMNGYGFCVSSNWTNYAVNGRITPHPVAGLNWTIDSFSGVALYVNDGLGGINHETDIASVQVYIFYSQVTSACPSGFDGVSCQLGQFFRNFQNVLVSIWNGISFFANFILYIFEIMIAVIGWIVTLFANFFIGFFGSIVYFYNLPGMPAFLQGIIDVVMTVFIGTIFLTMGGYIVGVIGGVVNKA